MVLIIFVANELSPLNCSVVPYGSVCSRVKICSVLAEGAADGICAPCWMLLALFENKEFVVLPRSPPVVPAPAPKAEPNVEPPKAEPVLANEDVGLKLKVFVFAPELNKPVPVPVLKVLVEPVPNKLVLVAEPNAPPPVVPVLKLNIGGLAPPSPVLAAPVLRPKADGCDVAAPKSDPPAVLVPVLKPPKAGAVEV